VACHSGECQRRTGTPFGVGAYFERRQVRIEGPSTVYARDGQDGRKLRMHFCPTCGTNLFWKLDLRPDQIGVAVGGFLTLPFQPRPARCGRNRAIAGSLSLTNSIPLCGQSASDVNLS